MRHFLIFYDIHNDSQKHKYLAELGCSNSFRSDDYEYNAVGVLHEEVRIADSLILKTADLNKVPAGSALAVDRENDLRRIKKTLNRKKFLDFSWKKIIKNIHKK